MLTRNYWVKADHPCSNYVYDGMMTAKYDLLSRMWYVHQHPYGCSKSYPCAFDAIRETLLSHGCENIIISEMGMAA